MRPSSFALRDVTKWTAHLLARSHSFEMLLPTEEETITKLLQIARFEGIPLSQMEAATIAAERNRIPRDCLKQLQRIRKNQSGNR